MVQRHRVLVLLFVLAFALFESACSTVMKPTRPSDPLETVGQVSGFRFDSEYVQLREPGMPLANSRAWQREVQNYTATTLNELLDTPDTVAPVQTIVVFDLASPSAIQIGTWKEMTIELTTMLPSGRVVRSEPVTENIDNPFEYFVSTGLMVTGSVLDVAVAIGTIILFVGLPGLLTSGWACGCLIAGLVVGLVLNLGQTLTTYLIAGSEERRWSDLYQRALTQHARDIERALAAAPPPPAKRAPSTTTQPPAPSSAPPAPSSAPPAPVGAEPPPPPPPILDPADEDARGAPPPDASTSPGATPPGGTAF